MEQSKKTTSRRDFVKKIAVGATVVGASGAAFLYWKKQKGRYTLVREPRFSANDQIQIALIGAGGMGVEDANTALQVPGTKLVAVCDLYTGRLNEAKVTWGKDLFTTKDYREILNRADVDAVIVATPDHWHKQISVDALMKGKGVYCEKPMVHDVSEGPALISAQQQSGKTFQVGSQGLSSLGNEKARQLYQSGAIGQLIYAEGFWARNSPVGAWQYEVPEDATPETVDWERYIANTTQRSFDPLRFFRWRNYRDYGTGVAGDLFVHLFSSLHFITSSMGPNKVMATGGLRYWKDGREVPDVLLGMFDYPESKSHPAFNLSLRVNFVDGTSGDTYLRMVGSEGAMDVTWDDVFLQQNIAADPMDAFTARKNKESNKAQSERKKMIPPEDVHYRIEKGYKGAHYDHFANFLNSVRTGQSLVEDAVFGYRAAAPALLCNESYFEGKTVLWDPTAMVRV